MTSDEGIARESDQMLNDIIRDADEYYSELKRRHVSETRLHVAVVGAIVWFASFAVLGFGVLFTIPRALQIEYLLGAFLTSVAIGAVASLSMYITRRRRGFKFAELGVLLDRIRGGKVSSEDGLRLTDVMHRVALTARKQRLDSAFEYGVAAFILVSIVGVNAGFGALAGVVVYLYFRFEALREFEREDQRYEDSKKELLLNL